MAIDIGRAWKVRKYRETLLATALLGASAVASAGSCIDFPALTISTFQFFQSQAFLLEDEEQATGTAKGTPPYFMLESITAQGAISGFLVTAGQQEYAFSGTVTQVGSDGLAISFSYDTNPTKPALGASYTYSGAMQLTSNCDVYVAGTFMESYMMPTVKGPVLRVTTGPYPFSGYAQL